MFNANDMAVATSMPIKTEPNLSPRKWSQPPPSSTTDTTPRISLCVGCGSEIYDQYILRVSPDLEWHASCLKCHDCQQYLDESCTCFVRDGKTYCKRDYLRLFGAKCAKCSMCFSKTDLVMRARNKIYHVECFRCAVCARQLTRGEEFVLKFDDLFCKVRCYNNHNEQHQQSQSIIYNQFNENHNSSNHNNNNNYHHTIYNEYPPPSSSITYHYHYNYHSNQADHEINSAAAAEHQNPHPFHPKPHPPPPSTTPNSHPIPPNGLLTHGPSNCSTSSQQSSSSASSSASASSSSLTPLTPVTPECLKERDSNVAASSQLLGLGGGGSSGGGGPPNGSPPSSLTLLNSSNISNGPLTNNGTSSANANGPQAAASSLGPLQPPPPPPHPTHPQMPLHPAGVIPGPGGDLNGHMNSSNISPSGGAGAPTHLSALSAVHMDHHASLTAGTAPPSSMTPTMNGSGQPPTSNNTNTNNNNSHNTSASSSSSSSNTSSSHHPHRSASSRSMSSSSSHHHNSKNPDHKPTRVRTVLNEKQLHTLRSCYNANPRPDALMKEQLVEMTGLSPRVIRVWFQNKRCKDKKRSILMKQMQQQEKDGRQLNIGQMRGVPLIATSPVRHESPVQMNPLDVHSYQPPWKALADYASMQPDIDPNTPQFQHLVSQMHGYTDGMNTPNETSLSSLGHGGPPTGPCTPMSYLADQDIHQPPSNMSSDLSSPCTSE